MEFKKATKTQAKARLALHGPAGAGKTFSALSIASHLASPIAVVDTEHGSASKYADKFSFDTLEVTGDYHPDRAIEAINLAAKLGYGVVIVDSCTHFWNGSGGFLELVDREVAEMKARGHKPDSFGAWKKVTPIYNRLIQTILSSPIHVFITLRAKMEYAKETDDRGKPTVKKLGLAPEMRDNFQYELDVEAMLNTEHEMIVGKTRCDSLDGRIFKKPGKDVADILKSWLTDGAPAPVKPAAAPLVDERSERISRAREMIKLAANREALDLVAKKLASSEEFIRTAVQDDFLAKQAELSAA